MVLKLVPIWTQLPPQRREYELLLWSWGLNLVAVLQVGFCRGFLVAVHEQISCALRSVLSTTQSRLVCRWPRDKFR